MQLPSQVTAALLALQVIPGAAGPNSQQEQQQQPAAPILDVPQLGPELQKLLQQPPGSNAQELYRLWQQGVPLQALGSMHSGNMAVRTGSIIQKLLLSYETADGRLCAVVAAACC
jgi:hypothetical protein